MNQQEEQYMRKTSPCTSEPGGRTVHEVDLPLYKGTRRKNRTGARPHPCTSEPGGGTVYELDPPVQVNQEEEQYMSQTSPCTREPGGRTVQELDLTPVQGNQEEEQYRN